MKEKRKELINFTITVTERKPLSLISTSLAIVRRKRTKLNNVLALYVKVLFAQMFAQW